MFLCRRRKLTGSNLRRLGPDAFQQGPQLVRRSQMNLAKYARVLKHHRAAIAQFEIGPDERGPESHVWNQVQIAGHPQVDMQYGSIAQMDEDMLASPRDPFDTRPRGTALDVRNLLRTRHR